MTDIITTSHSSASLFDTCPRQYEARYITKDVEFTSGPEADWGNEVHYALEKYIEEGAPLPSNMKMYTKYAEAVAKREGTKLVERAAAVNAQLVPVDFKDKSAWWRAKIDVTILRPDGTIELVDWKTGKTKNDPRQLCLYAALTFSYHPEVDLIRAGYCWLKGDGLTAPFEYHRRDLPAMWNMFAQQYARIVNAVETNEFKPKPSGLCNGWCPVKHCEYWRPKPAWRK